MSAAWRPFAIGVARAVNALVFLSTAAYCLLAYSPFGYQQFLKTAKTEVPATADHLKALQQFTEELKEGLGLPSLYNESLGTVSESYHYDRIQDRDKPKAERPKRPWEKAGTLSAAAAKKGRA